MKSEIRSIASRKLLHLYLIFVWIMCALRQNYLWISGDDANLLSQAKLMSDGLIPNIDYASGYPGLGTKILSYIFEFTGFTPLSEHIFSAILASILGIFFFAAFRNKNQFVVFLCLVFIYSQTFLNNPTPNPGHIFVICFLFVIHSFLQNKSLSNFHSLIIGVVVAISFLSKQYGVFTVCFIVGFLFLNTKSRLNETKRYWIYSISWIVIFLAYIFNLSLTQTNHIYFLIAGSPLVLSLILSKEASSTFINIFVGKRRIFQIYLALTFTTIFLWYYLYKFSSPIIVVKELFVLFPQAINGNIVQYKFDINSYIQTLFALGFFLSLLKISNYQYLDNSKRKFKFFFIISLSILSIALIGNLSATPFLFFISVIMYYFCRKNNRDLRLLILIIPYFIILLPYPNFQYHAPIFVYVFISIIQDNRILVSTSREKFLHNLVSYLIMAALVFAYSFHEFNWIKSLPRYQYSDTSFISADTSWSEEINKLNENPAYPCNSWGCTYLKLQNNENPLPRSAFLQPYWAKSGQ